MASIRKDNRAPRHSPRWLTDYRDPDGSRRLRRVEGATTIEQARRRLQKVEARLAEGLYGDAADQPTPPTAGLVTMAIEAWSRTLTNRNGKSDGEQARRWLVTAPPLQVVTLDQFDVDRVHSVVAWLETIDLAAGSRRNLFTLLSRWASWAASVRGGRLIHANPCRLLGRDDKPQVPRWTTQSTHLNP